MVQNSEALKIDIPSTAGKKKQIAAIIRALEEREGFLVLGHRDPDDDCIASMVAFALLASKMNRPVYVSLSCAVQAQYDYLLKICTYNSIVVLKEGQVPPRPITALVALDTPKPEQLDIPPALKAIVEDPQFVRIEIDHHIGADASYFGQEGYRLVAEASSSSELVGLIAIKMEGDRSLRERHQYGEILSRNLVLAVLTGMIGDSRMGKYHMSPKVRWFYERYSAFFNRLLAAKTRKGTGNFRCMEEVFNAIASLSSKEEACFRLLMSRARRVGPLAFIVLSDAEAEDIRARFGEDTLTSMAKSAADSLAEESGGLGLIAFCDPLDKSELLQFRVRRSLSFAGFDLRQILTSLSVSNGGGHPGAIGFRFPRSEVGDIEPFAEGLVREILRLMRESEEGRG